MVFDIVFWQVLIGFGLAWLVAPKVAKKKLGFARQLVPAAISVFVVTPITYFAIGSIPQNTLIWIGAGLAFASSFVILRRLTSAVVLGDAISPARSEAP